MKATGIVRRIDDLGRIVIPKEIRRTLRLREGTPLEIFTDREGEIILKKYSPMAELGSFAKQYADSLSRALSQSAAICDRDQILAVSGDGKKELTGKPISKDLETLIFRRETGTGQKPVPLSEEDASTYTAQIVCPILSEGDAIGAVILFSRSEKTAFLEAERKAVFCAALFLGQQMEN